MSTATQTSRKIIISLLLLLVYVTIVFSQRDDWVEPHAWGSARRSSLLKASGKPSACPDLECNCAATSDCPELSTVCPAAADCNCPEAVKCDNHSEYLYRKLVNYIFNIKNVKLDVISDQYHRNIHLLFTREQFDRLQSASDLREIDGILSDVLHHSSRTKTIDLVKEVVQSWSESVSSAYQSITSNRWLVNMVTLAMFAMGLYVCKRLKINVLVVAVSVVAFYTFQFLDAECQRNLEIERVAELLEQNQQNPCKGRHANWWNYMFSSPREDCKRYLGKTFERTCTIKDIYDGFFQAFVYGQMSLFLDSVASITSQINSKYGIMATILISLLLYANLGAITAAFFKYIIAPFIHRRRSEPSTHSHNSSEGAGDRLSGPNIDRLLSITENHARNQAKLLKVLSKKKIKLDTSGVQVIEKKSATENLPEPIASIAAKAIDKSECIDESTNLETDQPINKVNESVNNLEPINKVNESENNLEVESHSSSEDSDDDIVILDNSE